MEVLSEGERVPQQALEARQKAARKKMKPREHKEKILFGYEIPFANSTASFAPFAVWLLG